MLNLASMPDAHFAPRPVRREEMTNYRFLPRLPSNGAVAASVTLIVSGWFAIAAGAMWVDHAPADEPLRQAVFMDEAAPASPTPVPVAQARPAVYEHVVVEARRFS
jgi:hypothetical protein